MFDHYFFDFKYFLQKNASAENFATILNIEVKRLDKISISYYGLSFIDLINENRYQLFMQELKHPFNDNLTIHSLINLSGFENYECFINLAKRKKATS